jgi:hypothetical protein
MVATRRCRPTVTDMFNRRLATAAGVLIAATVIPVIVAVQIGSNPSPPPRPMVAGQPTPGPGSGSGDTTAAPADGGMVDPGAAYPRFDDRLLLPVIAIDVEAMKGKNGHVDGLTGPPWTPGPVRSFDDLFFHADQRSYFDQLVACFPELDAGPTPEDIYAAARLCFDPLAIDLAAAAADPTDVFVAFRALAHARPDVTTACHQAAHRVGEITLRRLYADRGLDYDAMFRILSLGPRSCLGGLIHGVYDAIGYMQPTLAEFENAVRVCERDPSLAGQCSDAVGHASWDGTGDVDVAMQVCSYWTELNLQATCVEGILMRMYQRLEVDDQWYNGARFGADADEFIAKTARVCDQFPTEPIDGLLVQSPAYLCHQGVVYLLVKPMYALVERNGGNYPEVQAEVDRLIGKVVEACDSFGPEGSVWCTDHVGTFLPGIAWFDEEQIVPMCTALGRNVDKCIADSEERITNTLLGRA